MEIGPILRVLMISLGSFFELTLCCRLVDLILARITRLIRCQIDGLKQLLGALAYLLRSLLTGRPARAQIDQAPFTTQVHLDQVAPLYSARSAAPWLPAVVHNSSPLALDLLMKLQPCAPIVNVEAGRLARLLTRQLLLAPVVIDSAIPGLAQ